MYGMGLVTVTTNPAIQTIAGVIQKTENTPASINNPGALNYAGQPGATGQPGQIATFDTYADGYQAMLRQIQLDANNGMTISDMMNSWAPASVAGNNPTLYAQYVASPLGVGVNTPVAAILNGTATGVSTASGGTGTSTSVLSMSDVDWGTVGMVVGVGAVAVFLISRR
jgi:hypothetical protein